MVIVVFPVILREIFEFILILSFMHQYLEDRGS